MLDPRTGIDRDPSQPEWSIEFYECYDDVLPETDRAAIDDFLQLPEWGFGWKSSSKTDVFAFWHKHFAGYKSRDKYSANGGAWPPPDCSHELQSNADPIYRFWRLLNNTVLEGHTLSRCYANALPYGAEGSLHTDSDSPDSFTCLYYPHGAWQPNWAGETVIFNEAKDDIVASIYPKPNRLLIFRGDVPHVARAVSRTCPALRVTLMFKTEKTPVS